jgi:hypothetical protein
MFLVRLVWKLSTPDVHWIVPTLSGGFLTGAGLMTIFLQALNYLVDAYLIVAASAIAANTFLQSFFGAGFRQVDRTLLELATENFFVSIC